MRFELTYYTPLFERGDFTKVCCGLIVKNCLSRAIDTTVYYVSCCYPLNG